MLRRDPSPTPSTACTDPSSTWAVDVVETNSFGSFSIVLAEYGIGRTGPESLSRRRGRDRTGGADDFARPGAPRFVAGSMGPGTKFPTLGQIPYVELSRPATTSWRCGLLEGGVDLFIVETMFDLLARQGRHRRVPRLAMAAPRPQSCPSRPRSPSS